MQKLTYDLNLLACNLK